MKQPRSSNIELLRILTIFGVVVLHYNGNVALGLVNPGTVNHHLLLTLEILFICAVNLFVLISGYFLCQTQKRSGLKALELVIQVMAFGVAKYLVTVILGRAPFSLLTLMVSAVPNNYYVTLYVAVYLLSPYVNILLKKLSDRQFTVLLVLYGALFALWPTVLDMVYATTGFNFNGLYPTNSGGSQFGYSFLNFLLMYLLGAYLRRCKPGKCSYDFLGAGVCFAVLLLWQLYYPSVARAYCNPFVIGLAVFIFRLFLRIDFSSKPVNTLAKGAFTCFLLHDFFLPHIGIGRVVNGNICILFAHLLLSCSAIFLVCWAVWWVYETVTRPIYKLFSKHFGKLDALLSPTEENEVTQ